MACVAPPAALGAHMERSSPEDSPATTPHDQETAPPCQQQHHTTPAPTSTPLPLAAGVSNTILRSSLPGSATFALHAARSNPRFGPMFGLPFSGAVVGQQPHPSPRTSATTQVTEPMDGDQYSTGGREPDASNPVDVDACTSRCVSAAAPRRAPDHTTCACASATAELTMLTAQAAGVQIEGVPAFVVLGGKKGAELRFWHSAVPASTVL